MANAFYTLVVIDGKSYLQQCPKVADAIYSCSWSAALQPQHEDFLGTWQESLFKLHRGMKQYKKDFTSLAALEQHFC